MLDILIVGHALDLHIVRLVQLLCEFYFLALALHKLTSKNLFEIYRLLQEAHFYSGTITSCSAAWMCTVDRR